MIQLPTLHPSCRADFQNFIDEIESPQNGSLMVTITSAVRSVAKQLALYKAGLSPTEVSLHNFGFAIDINIKGIDKNGNDIELMMDSAIEDWLPYVNIAHNHNLTWGGYFTYRPGGDKVHFQWAVAKKATVYLAAFEAKNIDSGGFVIV